MVADVMKFALKGCPSTVAVKVPCGTGPQLVDAGGAVPSEPPQAASTRDEVAINSRANEAARVAGMVGGAGELASSELKSCSVPAVHVRAYSAEATTSY
jgi:hypothetical protein